MGASGSALLCDPKYLERSFSETNWWVSNHGMQGVSYTGQVSRLQSRRLLAKPIVNVQNRLGCFAYKLESSTTKPDLPIEGRVTISTVKVI